MKTSNVVASPVQTRKAASRLAIIFEDFTQFQRQLGYRPRVIQLSIRVARHFANWLELCRLTLHDTNQDCMGLAPKALGGSQLRGCR